MVVEKKPKKPPAFEDGGAAKETSLLGSLGMDAVGVGSIGGKHNQDATLSLFGTSIVM